MIYVYNKLQIHRTVHVGEGAGGGGVHYTLCLGGVIYNVLCDFAENTSTLELI